MTDKNLLIGFVGQGWIGKNYADDFEGRGFQVVRYALEEPYAQNKERIKDCDIVFIAVPTPTKPSGFDDSAVREAVSLAGPGRIAVIKSTIVPGTTKSIQLENPDKFVMHSPEFLVSKTAAYDAAHPTRNIVGVPVPSPEFKARAELVMSVLPRAPHEVICAAQDAELIKYGANSFLFLKVVYANLMHDLAESLGADWRVVRDAIAADPRIGSSHMEPIHESGRGAGGHCFIKDFEAFVRMHRDAVGDDLSFKALEALRDKNIDLLMASGKDLDLLRMVYGDGILNDR